jgi:hypothetical protein
MTDSKFKCNIFFIFKCNSIYGQTKYTSDPPWLRTYAMLILKRFSDILCELCHRMVDQYLFGDQNMLYQPHLVVVSVGE